MRPSVKVACRAHGDGWTCDVTIDAGGSVSRHTVEVAGALLARLRPGADEPEDLVADSFAFLLEREAPGSILRSFELPVIGHYFPEWEAQIRSD